MIAEAPVVWLAPEPPSAEARRALDAWASARGVRIVEPAAAATPEVTLDLSVAERVEQEIDRAREAIAALDADAAERALARAERELLAHPELPQGAWLLAEVERGWAVRFARVAPTDEARAERAWTRAAGLDGGRASGIGEPRATAAVAVQASLTATAPPGFTFMIDGEPTALGPFKRTPGAHQLVVTHDGKTVWSAWVTLAEGTVVSIPDFSVGACSAEDLGRARLAGDAIDARGVRCSRWVFAAPIGDGQAAAVRVASCEGESCGPLLEWRAPRGGDFFATPPGKTPARWSAWGTWTLVGAGAVAVGVVVIVASGALQATHTETRFVSGGIKPQAATFPF